MLCKVFSAVLLLASVANTSPTISKRDALDDFVAKERDIAVQGVLANIGTTGSLAANASRGVVIGILSPFLCCTFLE